MVWKTFAKTKKLYLLTPPSRAGKDVKAPACWWGAECGVCGGFVWSGLYTCGRGCAAGDGLGGGLLGSTRAVPLVLHCLRHQLRPRPLYERGPRSLGHILCPCAMATHAACRGLVPVTSLCTTRKRRWSLGCASPLRRSRCRPFLKTWKGSCSRTLSSWASSSRQAISGRAWASRPSRRARPASSAPCPSLCVPFSRRCSTISACQRASLLLWSCLWAALRRLSSLVCAVYMCVCVRVCTHPRTHAHTHTPHTHTPHTHTPHTHTHTRTERERETHTHTARASLSAYQHEHVFLCKGDTNMYSCI